MEAPSNSVVQPQIQSNQLPQQSQKTNIFSIVVVFLLLLIVSVVSYFLGNITAQKKYTFVPRTGNDNQDGGAVACTMEAKICPDGSSVGRSGPNCEFAPCPETDITSGWKSFITADFPGEFKFPEKAYAAGYTTNDGKYHIFVSNNPVVIPEQWDSPFTPIDMTVISKATAKDNYASKVEEAKESYLADTLELLPIQAGQQAGVLIMGTFGDGYAGGERVTQAFFETNSGYVHAFYYPSVDKNFTEDMFKQIMLSVKLN